MSIHNVIPLITSLAPYSWPVTLLILAWSFRNRIKDVIELKFGDKFYAKLVPYGQVSSDLESDPTIDIGEPLPHPSTKQLSSSSGPKWENVSNVFWLGSDLIWTAQVALRGAPKAEIVHGLSQSYHHISELGLAESEPGQKLSSLKSETANLPEATLDRTWRGNFSEAIYGVTRMINGFLRQQQPEFRPNPNT